MPLEVIGAGFGRTGTVSLQAALDVLLAPKRCYHFGSIMERPEDVKVWERVIKAGRGRPEDWEALFQDEFSATADHPCCDFYLDMLEAYPTAKVILSEHPGGIEGWYSSRVGLQLLVEASNRWPLKPLLEHVYPAVNRVVFKANLSFSVKQLSAFLDSVNSNTWGKRWKETVYDREHMTGIYKRFYEGVEAKVPEEQLLVWNAAEGWEPLCRFLDEPLPPDDIPFPREDSHSTKSIQRVIAGVEIGLWAAYGTMLMAGVSVAAICFRWAAATKLRRSL